MTELRTISIDLIDASVHNPRQVFSDESLRALAESISRLGVLQPILVVHRPEANRFEIIAGERRWRASRIAQQKEIPALVIELDDSHLREAQIIENLEREQLNPIDEALAFKSLQTRFGYSDATLAQRLKRSTPFIRSRLDLLKLHPDVQQYVAEERIALGAALELVRVEEGEAQLQIAQEVELEKLTATDVAARVNRYKFEKRLQAQKLNKKLSLERKEQSLAARGVVVTPDSYIPSQHHRIWDLVFPECTSCLQKGTFLRVDGQVEDVCVQPDCFNSLLQRQQKARELTLRSNRAERRKAFERVLNTEYVMREHLQYLLWTMLNAMGPAIDKWRSEVHLSLYSDDPADTAKEWNEINAWPYEQLLTNMIRLSITYIADVSNSHLPEGLKQSLIMNFGIQPQLLDIGSVV